MLYVWKFFSNSHSDCFNKSHVTRATFLDDTHHLLVHSQLRTERSSWALSPQSLPGALSPLVWPFPIMSPAGSPGAPTPLGRLSAVSWGGLCGVRWKEQEVSMRLLTPAQQPAPTYWPLHSGWAQVEFRGPQHVLVLIPVLPTGESLSYSVQGAQGMLIHTLLPGPQGSRGQAPPRTWGLPGQVPPQGSAPRNHAQSPHCRAPAAYLLDRSDPEPLRAGPEATNSSFWTGLWPRASLCAASFQRVFPRLP